MTPDSATGTVALPIAKLIAAGEMLATSIAYEGLPPVAPEFDAAALRANILDSQRNGQPYREFT